MDRKSFLTPKNKQTGVTFSMPMEVDRELIDAHFKALTSKIEINIAEQLKGVMEAVKRVEEAVASMPKWEKQEPIKIPEVNLQPLLEAINRPRVRTITGRRGEHGLIDLNSIVVTEK